MNYSSPTRGDNGTPTHAPSSEASSTPPRLGVLGIGLIMEEVGKGARLVYRYPASPPPSFLDRSHTVEGESNGKGPGHANVRGGNTKNNSSKNKSDLDPSDADGSNEYINSASRSIDLFFDLPARVLSKLFRPKRPLCGQPLTLNVSGTTFCCRAELFDSQPSTIGGEEGSNHPLVLFSVIVALAPLAPSATDKTQQSSQHSTQYPFDFMDPTPAENFHSSLPSSQRSDGTFYTVRRVHQNLARLCRVLTREELRCRYVSRQCDMLLQIKNDYDLAQSRSGPDCNSMSAGSEGSGNNNSTMAADASSSKKGDTPPGPPPMSPKVTKEKALSGKGKDTMKSKVSSSDETMERPDMSRAQRREYVQNLIEIMLAASPPVDANHSRTDGDAIRHEQHGNLARELAQVFHWMSSPPATQGFSSLRVTAQEGVVYINRHIAVPLDQVDADSETPRKQYCVRPYHTILFPNSSPSEVLKGMMDGVNEVATSPSISHSLRRILPHTQPRKSLHEIAWEAGLSLPHVMEAATWLVHSGICVAAMPVLRKNRYASVEGVVPKMSSLALPFWQTFGVRSKHCKFHWGSEPHNNSADVDDGTSNRRRTVTTGAPHIFVVVSSLTTYAGGGSVNGSASPMLGEAIDSLSGVERDLDDFSPHYKRSDSFQYGENRHISRQASGSNLNLGSTGGVPINQLKLHLSPRVGVTASSSAFDSSAEEVVYSMVVWLVANKILAEVKEFLVAVESSRGGRNGNKTDVASAEESLYKDLLQSGCLDGNTSIPAICYRFGGLDRIRMEKFISWGQQSNRLFVVSRMACPTDDGGSP